MDENQFKQLYDAGRVQRYHTADMIKSQTIGHHSWGVAMIVLRIYPQASTELLKAALTHDLSESLVGDIPSPAKVMFRQLDVASKFVEGEFNRSYGIDYRLSPSEIEILRWADMLEGVLWCDHEIKMGNQYAKVIKDRYVSYLINQPKPTLEAGKLWEQMIGK